MSGPGVGFEYEPVPVSYNKRDALLFANSIGVKADELHFLYVSNNQTTKETKKTPIKSIHHHKDIPNLM